MKSLYKTEGTPKKARATFYKLAKKRIRYLTNEEFIKLDKATGGYPEPEEISPAFFGPFPGSHVEQVKLEKLVDILEIAINKDAFKIKGKDYSDLIPFVAEHEIYEAWLKVKKGAGSKLKARKKHILAQRRAFLLAEQRALGDRLLEWSKLIAPDNTRYIKECEYALKTARKQLGHLIEKRVSGL